MPPSKTRWRRSSYSNTNGGNCVEVSDHLPGGPTPTVPTPVWDAFISSLKA